MPHALTDRQREYLEFIRNYVAKNESSPRLDEIAAHFGVSSPTAHNMLEALHQKGYIYFARSKVSGFFIRLIDRAGTAERMFEIVVAGRVDKWGEVLEFPGLYGHFATVLPGVEPENAFALWVSQDIPEASMTCQDFILFDITKRPKPGDTCIVPIGKRYYLALIVSKTFDKDIRTPEMDQEYPIPQSLADPKLEQLLNWIPLAYDGTNLDYYRQVGEEQRFSPGIIEPELVLATALRLTRGLST